MKRLKLLVTKKYSNNDLPIVDKWNYDEIVIVGNDPLNFQEGLESFFEGIEIINELQGTNPKILIQTSILNIDSLYLALLWADGLIVTINNESDIKDFLKVNDSFNEYHYKNKTLH